MAATVLYGEDGLRSAIGTHLGYSDWLHVTPERLALFAQATGDADATYFAISVSNMFLPQIVDVQGFAMGINYGTDAVRFPTVLRPVMSLRGGATLDDMADVKGGVQTRMMITIEDREGAPVCTIESISRWLTPS